MYVTKQHKLNSSLIPRHLIQCMYHLQYSAQKNAPCVIQKVIRAGVDLGLGLRLTELYSHYVL